MGAVLAARAGARVREEPTHGTFEAPHLPNQQILSEASLLLAIPELLKVKQSHFLSPPSVSSPPGHTLRVGIFYAGGLGCWRVHRTRECGAFNRICTTPASPFCKS